VRCHQIAAIVADETRLTISGCDPSLPVCLSIAMIGTTTPSREMFAFADDNFLDFFQRTRIDENATGGDRFAAEGAIFVEFDAMTVLEEKNSPEDSADLMRERSVAEEMRNSP